MHFTGARYLPRILMLLKHILFVSWHVVLAYAIYYADMSDVKGVPNDLNR